MYGESAGNTGGGGGQFMAVKVIDIILDLDHERAEGLGYWDSLGSIFFLPVERIYKDPNIEIKAQKFPQDLDVAKPLFANIKNYPLKGEIVLLLTSTGKDIIRDTKVRYYLNNLNIWNHPHHNALPNPQVYKDSEGTKNDYKNYDKSAGGLVRHVTDGSTDIDLGNYFNERLNVKPLLPYEGDNIIEGRFGQSLRFGSTVPNDSVPQINQNKWSSGGETGDPITILRNGQGEKLDEKGWEPTIENINEDASSIYLTSTQIVSNFVMASTHWGSWAAKVEPIVDDITALTAPPAEAITEPEVVNVDEAFDETAWGSGGPDGEETGSLPTTEPAPTTPTEPPETESDDELSMYDELLESGDFTEDDFEEVLAPEDLGVEFLEKLEVQMPDGTTQNIDFDIDVSNVQSSGNIKVPLLAQGDSKWKDVVTYYNGGKYVIGPVGCALTSCCMIASYYAGKVITPLDAGGPGAYTSNTNDNTPNGSGALVEWGEIDKLMGRKRKFHYKGASPSKATEIMNWLIKTLDAKTPILWETKQSGKKRTSYSKDKNANACEYIKAYNTSNQAAPKMKKYVWGTQHWMVIVGYNASADANSNPTFQVNDPSGAAFRPAVPLKHLVARLGRFVVFN